MNRSGADESVLATQYNAPVLARQMGQLTAGSSLPTGGGWLAGPTPNAYSDTQGIFISHGSTPNDVKALWNGLGNSGHPGTDQRSNSAGNAAFAREGLLMSPQHLASDRFPAGQALQNGGLSGNTNMGGVGGHRAVSGYSNGEQYGNGRSLWGYHDGSVPPKSGLWGYTGVPDQRAGHFGNIRNGQHNGGSVNGGGGMGSAVIGGFKGPQCYNLNGGGGSIGAQGFNANGGGGSSENYTSGGGQGLYANGSDGRERYSAGVVQGFNTGGGGNFGSSSRGVAQSPDRTGSAELYAMMLHQSSAGPHQQPQHAQQMYGGGEAELLAQQLAELGLHEDMAAQQASLQEAGRRQQQLAYLNLLQQQQASLRRQQQQLRQQQQAIASGAASPQHGYGGMGGSPQGGHRRAGTKGLSSHMRSDMPHQRMQKQMYQQQPATVGLRGQTPARYLPPVPRPQQHLLDVQDPQISSLSIHDKGSQPVAPLKRLPKADVMWLSQQLSQVVQELMPSSEECSAQAAAFDHVSHVLKARWPEGQVHLFGSTANCLAITHNNDIDVCLELPALEGDQAAKGEVVVEMARVLTSAGMQDVLPLGKARVPVVKCIVPESGTQVDVTLNHTMAVINTKLLADYCAIDGRLMQLVFIVKQWAKRRQVDDAYRGTLSSYCYVLMCIHLLQQRQPPILPCLQAMQPHTFQKQVGQWDCSYFDKVGGLVSYGAANTESLGELVWAFFEYWAWKHDYNTAVVSVRTGGFLTKNQKEWTRRIGNERHLVSIEDPFELSHDLGRTVDRQTSMVLHKEFERAACILRDMHGGIEKLLEPYRAGKTD